MERLFPVLHNRAGKVRFYGTRKSALFKPSSGGERCAPRNFVNLVTLQGTCVCLMCLLRLVPRRAPNKIGYGKMKQCNNILQSPHVRTETLPKKRKP